MKDYRNKEKHPTRGGDETAPQSISRRTLLRRGVTAAPVVLTLPSGAALARSSNLIGEAPAGTRDMNGNTLCLDTSRADPLGDNYKYDLHGGPHDLHVISDGEYFYAKDGTAQDDYDDYDDYDDDDDDDDDEYFSGQGPEHRRVSTETICHKGGTFYYRDRGWHSFEVPSNGIVVSATALLSVSARANIDYIPIP